MGPPGAVGTTTTGAGAGSQPGTVTDLFLHDVQPPSTTGAPHEVQKRALVTGQP